MASTNSEQLSFCKIKDGKNNSLRTWSDLGLVPREQLFFEIPILKTNYVDIPGRSGKLDLTNCLTPWNYYDNLTGSFEFYMIDPKRFSGTKSTTENFLSGRTNREKIAYLNSFFNGDNMRCWFGNTYTGQCREGRFWISSIHTEEDITYISISYDVLPYSYYATLYNKKETTVTVTNIPIGHLNPGESIDITEEVDSNFSRLYSTIFPITPVKIGTRLLTTGAFSILYKVRNGYIYGDNPGEKIPGIDDVTLIKDKMDDNDPQVTLYKIPDNMYLYGNNTNTDYFINYITPTWTIKNISNRSFANDARLEISIESIDRVKL